jgi:hypothetical protein
MNSKQRAETLEEEKDEKNKNLSRANKKKVKDEKRHNGRERKKEC